MNRGWKVLIILNAIATGVVAINEYVDAEIMRRKFQSLEHRASEVLMRAEAEALVAELNKNLLSKLPPLPPALLNAPGTGR